MNTPPAEITSGCWPGKPHAVAGGENDDDPGGDRRRDRRRQRLIRRAERPVCCSLPQLQVMMCGFSADGRVERAHGVDEVDLDRQELDVRRDGEDVGRFARAVSALVGRRMAAAGPSTTGDA